jgi:hypothetical protein
MARQTAKKTINTSQKRKNDSELTLRAQKRGRLRSSPTPERGSSQATGSTPMSRSQSSTSVQPMVGAESTAQRGIGMVIIDRDKGGQSSNASDDPDAAKDSDADGNPPSDDENSEAELG